MATTYTPLYTTTANGSTTSITFSSISGSYTDLVLVINGYMASGGYFDIQVGNGSVDVGSNYSYTRLYGTGSSAGSNRASNTAYVRASLSAALNATSIINFQNYANVSTYRTVLLRYSSTDTEAAAVVGTWRNTTSAINTITLTGAGNWVSGTTFSLYGVGSSSLTTKATGGVISTDGTYTYHTFYSSGTFTPSQSLTADILVVAGGGGAGATQYSQAGGGGAGGLLGFISQSLSSGTGYSVTIGAGGNGGTGSNATGSQGSNSQFGGLTACIGGGGGGTNYHPSGDSFMNGGSGGGGGNLSSSTTNRGTGTAGQGNDGAYLPANYQGGGGGGASEAGPVNTSSSRGGNGSSAYSSWGSATLTGQNVSGTYYYAGGGAGSAQGAGDVPASRGGYGGGGYAPAATSTSGQRGISGTPNTGGGGGGWASNSGAQANGGNGGSGIVIVRYAI